MTYPETPQYGSPQPPQESFGKKVWRISYPLLVYLGASVVVGMAIGIFLMGRYMSSLPQNSLENMTEVLTELVLSKTLLITLVCDAAAIPFMILFMVQDRKRDLRLGRYVRYEKPSLAAFLGFAVLGIGMCITENNLLDISGLTQTFSEDTEMIADLLYQGGIWFELLVVGLVGPVLEELLFRGVILKRLCDYMRPVPAAVISALIFGAFHGNMLQFIYAFVFGLGLAYICVKFRTVWAPLLAHCAGNITSILLTETPLLENVEEWSAGHYLFIVIGAFLALGGFALVYYTREPAAISSSDARTPEYM